MCDSSLVEPCFSPLNCFGVFLYGLAGSAIAEGVTVLPLLKRSPSKRPAWIKTFRPYWPVRISVALVAGLLAMAIFKSPAYAAWFGASFIATVKSVMDKPMGTDKI